MVQKQTKTSGFTIVELLIVIVVIAILAAITIVSYNGIQSRAREATVQSDLENAAKQLEIYKLTLSGAENYPVNLSTAALKASANTAYAYSYNATSDTYCLTATNSGISYYIAAGIPPKSGTCLLTDGLVGWWKLNGNANDTSGNSNNGTNTGAVLTTGQDGQANGAYSFNGSSKISLPATAAVTGNNTYAISVWVKPTAYGNTKGIVGWGLWGTNSNANAIRLTSTGINHYWWYNDLVVTKAGLADGFWHSIIAQFNGTTRSIYVDGALVGSDTPVGHNATANDVNIGVTYGTEYFTGSIDDVRIYDKALQVYEIQALYGAGAQ